MAREIDTAGELGAELRRWSLCRTFRHQFSLVARRMVPEATRARTVRGGGGGVSPWRPWVRPPERALGLAAAKWAQQRPERAAELKQDFRRAGAMSRGELFRHFKRIGQIEVFFAMYPEP